MNSNDNAFIPAIKLNRFQLKQFIIAFISSEMDIIN